MINVFDFSSPSNFIKKLQEEGVMVYATGGKFKTTPTVTHDESVFMYIADNNEELVSIVMGGGKK